MQLVAAFRATLEEIESATLIVHVVDVSHPKAAAQSAAVDKVLAELDVNDIPVLTVWNKVRPNPSTFASSRLQPLPSSSQNPKP